MYRTCSHTYHPCRIYVYYVRIRCSLEICSLFTFRRFPLTYTASLGAARHKSPLANWIAAVRFVHVDTVLASCTFVISGFALVNVDTAA